MALLVVRDLTHSFGGPPVLDGATLRVEAGDRICLFGRNGEGKSTLMAAMAGQLKPDSGGVDVSKTANVALLGQTVPDPESGTVLEVVTADLGNVRDALARYQRATQRISEDSSPEAMAEFEAASTAIEAADGWALQQRVETALSRLGLEPEVEFATLSGGWRRRVALARALALQPDILLLDEPTNHLDVDAIEWLEDLLIRFEGAIVFVTHDRSFLRRVATRIVELDRGELIEFPPDFDEYLEAKERALDVEDRHDALFDKRLAEEEAWIRTGIKARRTRNEGRVRALKAMRQQRRRRRERKGAARIQLHDAGRSGELVVEADGVTFAYDDGPTLVDGLDLRLGRGDRLGFIGPNGVGKTTLLRLLMGDLEPDAGTVRHGTRLQVRYYDQLRATLDESKTLAKTLAPDGDRVMVNGEPKHIISYLRDFLFDDSQANAPVSVLSGGERNRLLLAKLFAEPANVLVLDEPTNDLDIETLQVLEDQLLSFGGTILLVSHDRAFLDAVATQSLVFEGDGVITTVAGGYEAWTRLRRARQEEGAEVPTPEPSEPQPGPAAPAQPKEPTARKLKYGERLELEALPAKIEAAENEQAELMARLQDPDVMADHTALAAVAKELEDAEAALEQLYARWTELEEA